MARALSVALACAFVVASCGGPERATLRLQIFGDAAEIAAYRELIAEFERTDDAGVELIAVPNQSDHVAKLATGFSSGTEPDLFLINYRRAGQFAARGVLEPLGERLRGGTLKSEDFYPQALDAFTFDGTVTCLPQNISSLVVYWNRRLFREAGVAPPRRGWTWEEFLAKGKALTEDRDGDGRIDVYGLGTEPTLVRLSPFVWQSGAEVVDDTEHPTQTVMTDPGAIRALKFFIELRRVHRVAPSHEEAESEDYETRFAAGRLAMLLESRRTTAMLRGVKDLDWDVAPLPRKIQEATVLHSDAYCLSKGSENRDAAIRFVEFALGPKGAPIIARSGRTVPSLRSVAESVAFLDPGQAPASARVFLDEIPNLRRLPNIETWNEIERKADPIVEEWYYGTESPQALGIEIDLATRDLFPS